MVAGASEVRLPDRGGNPAAVACGDCLRMAVDIPRPGSWEGNFWLGTLGERSYRFWLGLIVAAAAGCALLLFFVTG